MTENGTTALAVAPAPAGLPEAVEQALVHGNLAQLSPVERVVLYTQTCDSLGLNRLTTPFQYITLNGKLTLYATRNCTDQLRNIHNVNVTITSRARQDDIYVVTARAQLPNGRTDEEIGAVSVIGLKGEALANAMMKAGTKAKRRVTLSIVGLSLLDETEVETIPGAQVYAGADAPQFQRPEYYDRAPAPVVRVAATPSPSEPPRAPDATASAPGGGAIPITTHTQFWSAAHRLLGGSRGQVSTQVAALLGQEAGAFQQAHQLTWTQTYDVLVGKWEDSKQTPEPQHMPAAVDWHDEEEPSAEEVSEAVRTLQDDMRI